MLQLIDQAVAAGARLAPAAHILGLSPRTVIRWRKKPDAEDGRNGPRTVSARRYSETERARILRVATSEEFRDMSPKQLVPQLADQGTYLGSESTFYRVLRTHDMLTHRQASKPATSRRPKEHIATGPNQVWSWDITYLKTPVRGLFFYLYMMVDVWSRKIVADRVYDAESHEYSSQLLVEACIRLGINPDGLVLHSDNGGPMKGATMTATMQKLGIVPSLSRPRVSNDNPYSESLFRTLKYRPEYPSQPFFSVDAAQQWVDDFVFWYNTRHLHSAIRFISPDDRHYGREHAILAHRQQVYENARRENPGRWAGTTRNWKPIREVQLNPEKSQETLEQDVVNM